MAPLKARSTRLQTTRRTGILCFAISHSNSIPDHVLPVMPITRKRKRIALAERSANIIEDVPVPSASKSQAKDKKRKIEMQDGTTDPTKQEYEYEIQPERMLEQLEFAGDEDENHLEAQTELADNMAGAKSQEPRDLDQDQDQEDGEASDEDLPIENPCDCELGPNHTRDLHDWRSTPPLEVFSALGLIGEAEDAVEVYDSCDEIRRKISDHLTTSDMSMAEIGRRFHAQLHGPRRTKSIPGAQVSAFLKKSGSRVGNTTVVFYAAFVYFEKLRLLLGEEKSEHRLTMEDIWLEGFDLKTLPHNINYVVGPSLRDHGFEFDEFGEPEWFPLYGVLDRRMVDWFQKHRNR